MSKENEKKEMLNLRLSKKRKDSLRASATRQGISLSKLVFNNLDTMRIKGIKEDCITVLDNFKHIDGIVAPDYNLKDGQDGSSPDLDVISNLLSLMVDMTNELNPINHGIKGAIRKANGDYKPQQLDSHTNILRKLKNKGKK